MPIGVYDHSKRRKKPTYCFCGKQLSARHYKFCSKHRGIPNKGSKNKNWKGGKPKCEICGKTLCLRGYKRCQKHKIISGELKKKYRNAQLKRVAEGRHNTFKASRHYRVLHHWVECHLGKPTKCEFCGRDGLVGRQIHWANKSQKYLRKLTDWLRLCVPCHKAYDSKTNP